VVFAEIDAPFGALPFLRHPFELALEEGHVREAQVKAFAAHIHDAYPSRAGFPPIVAGRFQRGGRRRRDSLYAFACVRSAIGGVYFADAFGLVGRGEGATFSSRNPFAADLAEPDRRIDYIFVRGDERGRGEADRGTRLFHDRPHRGVPRQRSHGVSVRCAPRLE